MSQLVTTPTGSWSLVDLTSEEVSMVATALETAVDVINEGVPTPHDPGMIALARGVLMAIESGFIR